MADTIVKKGFEEFDRGTIENIAEYLSPEELYSDVIERVRKYHPSDDMRRKPMRGRSANPENRTSSIRSMWL